MKPIIGGITVPTSSSQANGGQPNNRFVPAPLVADTITSIPAATTSGVQFVQQVRTGLSLAEAQQQARQLTARLHLTLGEMAAILATSERTFARQLGSKPDEQSAPMTMAQAERLLLLRLLAAHGLAVFEDQEKFNRWLRRPLQVLQQQSPLQLLDTVTGFRLIDQLLGRIEQGVYS